jgi:hypothetical protein
MCVGAPGGTGAGFGTGGAGEAGSKAVDATTAGKFSSSAAQGSSGQGGGAVPKFDNKPLLADAVSTPSTTVEETGERRPTGPRDGTTASRQAQKRKATSSASTSFQTKEKKATALKPVQTTLLGEQPLF